MASFATHFFLLTITLLFVSCLSLPIGDLKLRTVLPIRKDPITSLFYTSVGVGTPRHNFDLVIDLGGPILWYDCNNHYNSSTYRPVSCDSKSCSNTGAGCTSCDGPLKPGCTNNTCGANILNPLANVIFSGDTGEDVLFISSSIVSVLSGCASSDAFNDDPPLLKGLPQTSKGILGLARTQLALPTQLSSSELPHKFALCLPSSNKNGLGNLFLGGAPDSLPHQPALLTTPLIINPFSTAPIFSEGDASYEYFIVVKSIKIGGEVLDFKSSLLSIDSKGNGGTKIITMNPFTVLHSSIHKPLVRDFVKKAADRKIKKVEAVAPFGACFDLSTIGKTITGLDVPTIDLVLQGDVEWTIYGGNSMVLVNEKVACLGFVDGGKTARTAVVIGGHQLEDNLVEFDLGSSKLGFSSSLLLQNATCSPSKASSFPF
ncbi:probable aspartic proteinase GIP2 [Lotus japonicus]|uniref:probable aspartic proteinase GIP2 n=1 Tax=Lotus japonicus TaxID=34305 RepID=UPI002586EF0D|nr:probable aspartic proteinase GIP2 [Lotus japonicus]